MNKTISILIADDHDSLRELLKYRIDVQPDMKVVAHVGDAEAAVTQAVAVKPDIVLMDIDMPGLSAFDAAERIGVRCRENANHFLHRLCEGQLYRAGPGGQSLGLCDQDRAGGHGHQGHSRRHLGFRLFLSGGAGPTGHGTERSEAGQENQSLLGTLTEREREVLCYVARGMTKKDMAETMCVSVKTVDYHCTNVMDKLKIHDRVELTRFAIREGLVDA